IWNTSASKGSWGSQDAKACSGGGENPVSRRKTRLEAVADAQPQTLATVQVALFVVHQVIGQRPRGRQPVLPAEGPVAHIAGKDAPRRADILDFAAITVGHADRTAVGIVITQLHPVTGPRRPALGPAGI